MRLLQAARKRSLREIYNQKLLSQPFSSISTNPNDQSTLHYKIRKPHHGSTRNHSGRPSIPEKETFEDFDLDDILEEDEPSFTSKSSNPWKNLLTNPARAAWRVTDPQLPSNISFAYEQVLEQGGRTPRQLKRAHRNVLEIHKTLAEFREKERRRMVNGKHYRSNSDETSTPVYYGHDETLATLKHRMMPTYAVTRRVLQECQSLLGHENWQPQRVLDFGIGCGSASVAALDLFDSVDWIHGIEPSNAMRDCAQAIVEGMSKDRSIEPRVTFSTTMPNDESAATTGGSFDLALCCYTATELPDVMSTLTAAALMFEKLKPGGVFVMIEPGTPDGFNSIRSVRNMLLDCCPPDDDEFEWEERCHIIAPCTHNGSCPMERHKKDFVKKGKLAHDLPQDLENADSTRSSQPLDEPDEDDNFDTLFVDGSSTVETDAFNSSFCSFVQTLPNSKNGEKFSYLVAQKRLYNDNTVDKPGPFQSDNLAELLMHAQRAAAEEDEVTAMNVFDQAQGLEDRYLDSDHDELGLELLRGDTQRNQMGRIIRAPIKKKGHIYIDYCAHPGRIIRDRVTKATSNNVAPGMFSAARKSRWGGLWPNTNPNQEYN